MRANGTGTETVPAYRFSYVLKQLQEALRRQLAEITEQFDLTPTQYTALSVLAKYPGLSSASLARLTFVSPQAANEMVTTLERKGFLTRAVDTGDGRRLQVTPTRAGTRTLARCDALVDRLEAGVLRDLDLDEQERLRRALHTCLQTFDERTTVDRAVAP